MIAALLKNSYFVATVLTVAIFCLLYLINVYYQRKQTQVLRQLSCLASAIFACFASQQYPENQFYFERRIQKQKIKCLRKIKGRSQVSMTDPRLELLELIIDIGQLRRRVKDHTVFAVCQAELKRLSITMKALLVSVHQKSLFQKNAAAFAAAIDQFEDIVEHVVSVTAREPLVFILFINALRLLLQNCQEVSNHWPQITTLTAVPTKILTIDYPAWVFVPELSRYLRGASPNTQLQLGGISEILFSLDYYIKQPVDPYILPIVIPQLEQVAVKNNNLLSTIYTYYTQQKLELISDDLTNDIVDLRMALQATLPGSIELLDVSPDYLIISALARDVIDMRELLLQVLASLPVSAGVSVP